MGYITYDSYTINNTVYSSGGSYVQQPVNLFDQPGWTQEYNYDTGTTTWTWQDPRFNTTIKENEEVKIAGNAKYTISAEEMRKILGLEDGEEIATVQWENGSNHFQGGLVVNTNKKSLETEITAVKK